jgi:hypothetical protein
MNEPLLDLFGFCGGMTAVVVDRRRAVPIAALAIALALSPTAAGFGGGPAVLVLLGTAAAGVVVAAAARLLGQRLRGSGGLDPLVPVFSPPRELFGPRSLRVVAAALCVPAASWVSYNVPVGLVVPVRGLLFPVVFAWACGLIRILLARTIEDLAVGAAVVGLATACAVVARGGDAALPTALVAALVAPVAAALADWLSGRRAGRAGAAAAA